MKGIKGVLLILITVIFLSCVKDKKESDCMPGFVLLVYMGENDKPIYPLLLKTNDDVSCHQYIGDSQEQFEKNGFIIDGEHIKNHKISSRVFIELRNYIINNDTGKNEVVTDEGYNSLKVILSDRCDSVVYVIDKTNENYLSRLKDSLKTFDDRDLNAHLDYYEKILSRNIEERYKEKKMKPHAR